MSCVTNPTVKPLSMANAACLISLPALFTPKTPYPYLSISILSKPIKFQVSCSYFTLNSSSSLKKKNHFPAIVAFVASQELDEEKVEEEDAGESVGEEEYSEPSEDAKLFVANLSFDVDSEKLAELLQKAGTVEIAEVVYNRVTEKSRGFAFVTMSTVEEAEKAVDLFKGYEFYGRPLHIAKAAPSGTRLQSKQIYISNLAWDVDDSRLEQVFSEYGKVVNVRVVCDRESGLSRGFGFVTMSTESEVHDAIANLDGETIGGRAIRVKMAKQREGRISS